MATKFYTITNPVAPESPPWQGAWNYTTGYTTLLDIEPYGGGTTYPYKQLADAGHPPPQKVQIVSAVSRPLLPQTISGTFNAIIAAPGSASYVSYLRFHIWIRNVTANTVFATLLNQYEDTTPLTTNWTGAATLAGAQTLTPCTIPSDSNEYRLIIEIGIHANVAAGTFMQPQTVMGSVQRGTYDVMPDLTIGANGINNAGTFTFSHDFLFPALPAQPNRIQSGAIDISTLPINQTINTLGNWYLWYKFSATENITLSAAACNTTPREVWMNVYSEPDTLPIIGTSGKQSVIFPIKTGNTIYLLVATPYSPAGDPITFDIIKAPQGPVQIGDILVLSDNTSNNYYDPTIEGGGGYASWFTPDGNFSYVSHKFVATELGVSLANGKLVIADQTGTDEGMYRIFIYDKAPALTEIRRINLPPVPDYPSDIIWPAVLGTDFVSFYVGSTSDVGDRIVFKISEIGVIDPKVWRLCAGNEGSYGYVSGGGNPSIGVTRDGAILYWGDGFTGGTCRRHNMITDTEILPAFTPPIGGAYRAGEVIVMKDNSVVCLFLNGTSPKHKLVHYSPSGVILREVPYDPPFNLHHICHNFAYDMKVWIFHNMSGLPGGNRFQLFNLETGLIEKDFLLLYSDESPPAGSCTHAARWDCAGSCPLMVMMQPFDPETGEPVIIGIPGAGLYVLDPDKLNDTIYTDPTEGGGSDGIVGSEKVKIPNPFVKTAYIGS